MGYIEQERCIRFCDDLRRMIQDEKTAVARFLGGDICEEYQKLLERETEELLRLKRMMSAN